MVGSIQLLRELSDRIRCGLKYHLVGGSGRGGGGRKITEMSVVCTFDKIGTYQTVSIRNGLHVIS